MKSKQSTITVKGNTRNWCGWESRYATITINGNTDNWCGALSEHANITINGNTRDRCGANSKRTTITINGKIGANPSPDAHYKTNNPTTYQTLLDNGCTVERTQ